MLSGGLHNALFVYCKGDLACLVLLGGAGEEKFPGVGRREGGVESETGLHRLEVIIKKGKGNSISSIIQITEIDSEITASQVFI